MPSVGYEYNPIYWVLISGENGFIICKNLAFMYSLQQTARKMHQLQYCSSQAFFYLRPVFEYFHSISIVIRWMRAIIPLHSAEARLENVFWIPPALVILHVKKPANVAKCQSEPLFKLPPPPLTLFLSLPAQNTHSFQLCCNCPPHNNINVNS